VSRLAAGDLDHGWVLHRRRYRETSLIVEFLTREHGRVAAVARGALRGRSALAGILQPATPVGLALRGRGELMTLTHAEPLAPAPSLVGDRLYCLFYLNELVLRLTAAHDPNPPLIEVYAEALTALAADAPLAPDADYHYLVERGPVRAGPASSGVRVQGATLLALAADEPLSTRALAEAKRLMREVLHHHLDGRPLASRALFEAQGRGKP
jgi:DNA repair protein RecO (recombination protein O)